MKSLSYLSSIHKTNNQIPTAKLTKVNRLLFVDWKNGRESKQTWNQNFEENAFSFKENFIFIFRYFNEHQLFSLFVIL